MEKQTPREVLNSIITVITHFGGEVRPLNPVIANTCNGPVDTGITGRARATNSFKYVPSGIEKYTSIIYRWNRLEITRHNQSSLFFPELPKEWQEEVHDAFVQRYIRQETKNQDDSFEEISKIF